MDRLGRADVLVLQTFRWSFEPPAASPVIWGMGRVAVAWGTAATGRGPDPVPVGWAPVVAVLRDPEAPGVATPRGVWSSNDPFSSVSFQGSRPRAYG